MRVGVNEFFTAFSLEGHPLMDLRPPLTPRRDVMFGYRDLNDIYQEFLDSDATEATYYDHDDKKMLVLKIEDGTLSAEILPIE